MRREIMVPILIALAFGAFATVITEIGYRVGFDGGAVVGGRVTPVRPFSFGYPGYRPGGLGSLPALLVLTLLVAVLVALAVWKGGWWSGPRDLTHDEPHQTSRERQVPRAGRSPGNERSADDEPGDVR